MSPSNHQLIQLYTLHSKGLDGEELTNKLLGRRFLGIQSDIDMVGIQLLRTRGEIFVPIRVPNPGIELISTRSNALIRSRAYV